MVPLQNIIKTHVIRNYVHTCEIWGRFDVNRVTYILPGNFNSFSGIVALTHRAPPIEPAMSHYCTNAKQAVYCIKSIVLPRSGSVFRAFQTRTYADHVKYTDHGRTRNSRARRAIADARVNCSVIKEGGAAARAMGLLVQTYHAREVLPPARFIPAKLMLCNNEMRARQSQSAFGFW